jgi:hypothetical protein
MPEFKGNGIAQIAEPLGVVDTLQVQDSEAGIITESAKMWQIPDDTALTRATMAEDHERIALPWLGPHGFNLRKDIISTSEPFSRDTCPHNVGTDNWLAYLKPANRARTGQHNVEPLPRSLSEKKVIEK